MIGFVLPRGPLRVLAIGAHCDDIEIGAGGTLARLLASRDDVTLGALVLTSSPRRAQEAQESLQALGAAALTSLRIEALPDGRLPGQFDRVKDILGEVASEPWDLVLAPQPDDAHQDHAMLGRLTPTALRDALILHYEIPKWDGDLGSLRATTYVGLSPQEIHAKWDHLDRYFPSQRGHDWWDKETFTSLARLRGMECRMPYAEAFRVSKSVITLGDPRTTQDDRKVQQQ